MTRHVRRKRVFRPKTISVQGIAGQKGINLIEGILLDMGSRWTPSGPNEVGIDGYIELFDPSTRVSLGLTLAVQSKVVSSIREAGEEFVYSCEASDLEYWLKGNTPVILIVSDPETRQAYWVWIQSVFADWKPGKSTAVRFLKSKNRFDPPALADLVAIGAPSRGLYLAPRPKQEKLWSNLLGVEAFPDLVFVAVTSLRRPEDVWAVLNERKIRPASGWILWERKIVSFEDLSTTDWEEICEPGTVEGFETSEWSESSDPELRPERMRLFVQLLNQTLRAQLNSRARFWPKDDCFAMIGEKRRQAYQSLKRTSHLSVVSSFKSKSKDGREFEYRRHLAFRGQFRYLEDGWFLEITPTYRFTSDGYRRDRFHQARLKRIKEIEGNRAVLSCVLFWADFLRPDSGLFAGPPPPIQFGELKTVEIDRGIDDSSWLRNDPETAVQDQQGTLQGLLPMQLPSSVPSEEA